MLLSRLVILHLCSFLNENNFSWNCKRNKYNISLIWYTIYIWNLKRPTLSSDNCFRCMYNEMTRKFQFEKYITFKLINFYTDIHLYVSSNCKQLPTLVNYIYNLQWSRFLFDFTFEVVNHAFIITVCGVIFWPQATLTLSLLMFVSTVSFA